MFFLRWCCGCDYGCATCCTKRVYCTCVSFSLFAINRKEMNLTNSVIGTRNKHRNSQQTTVWGVIKATPKSFIILCRCGGAERCSGTRMMSAYRLNVWLCYPRHTPEICTQDVYTYVLHFIHHHTIVAQRRA